MHLLRTNSQARRGAALLAVLGFITLMSIMLVCFMASMQTDRRLSYNYGQSVAAEEIAWGGLQEVISDLKREIDAGSLRDGVPEEAVYTRGGIRFYIPSSNFMAQPMRVGFPTSAYNAGADSLSPALVKVSRADDAFYTAPPAYMDSSRLPRNRASAVPSTLASVDGRRFSASRWNKPLLMSTNLLVPAAFSNAPPDWVYVTRGGSRSFTEGEIEQMKRSRVPSQTSQVLGRYAYVVYETGGLLDINAAGYPQSAAVAVPAQPGAKTYIAHADLTQLPGLSQTAVDKIIAWRNKGGVAASTNYFLLAQRYATNGFLIYAAGDNPLLSRQDLLRYFAQLQSEGTVPDLKAVPYLGTFSRALNGPSWMPEGDPTNLAIPDHAYWSRRENVAAANRAIANVRVEAPFVRSDGSNAKLGEPLVNRRFPLSRLSLLSDPSANASQIMTCFGLKWDADKARWDYNHGDVSNILTLAQVAAVGREPDFFELLKAGILRGSLGKDPGEGCTPAFGSSNNSTVVNDAPSGYNFEKYMPVPDMQILAIGANIIDQYDADGYPTAIYCKFFDDSSLAVEQGPVNTVFGIENLPMVTRLFDVQFETKPNFLSAWLQPEIFNIHQAPNAAPANRPTRFRITMLGAVISSYKQINITGTISSPRVNYDGSQPESHVYFTDAGNATSPFYNTPTLLTKRIAGCDITGTPATNMWQPTVYQPTEPGAPAAEVNEPFVGIYCGSAPYQYPSITKPATPADPTPGDIQVWIAPDPVMTVVTEYWDGSNWRPYNYISRLRPHYYRVITPDLVPAAQAAESRVDPANHIHGYNRVADPGADTFFGRSDPRTDRFSISHSQINFAAGGIAAPNRSSQWQKNLVIQTGNDVLKTQTKGNVGRGVPRLTSGFYVNPLYIIGSPRFCMGDWAINQNWNTYVYPNAPGGQTGTYYTDPDGEIRPGDGFRMNLNLKAGQGTGEGALHLSPPGTTAATVAANTQHARRPLILNRPFRSVAELGYAYRDLPYKSLDFFSVKSADAALLDLFSIEEEPAMSAGQINLQTASVPVLQAILSGSSKRETDVTLKLNAADTPGIANAIALRMQDTTKGPLLNRAGLVTQLSDVINQAFPATAAAIADGANKSNAEAPIRALCGVANTRTWNLMIDVVAQSGRMSPSATKLADFLVEGERRYWLHVAIDRYTGKVLDQQLEIVNE